MTQNTPWPRIPFKNILEAKPFLVPGDLISRPKRGGIGEHWGVFLPNGNILERQLEDGVRVIAVEDFAILNEKIFVVKPPDQFRNFVEIEFRANQELSYGKIYDFLTRNCEHTATYVATGRASSGQIFLLFLLTGLSLGLYLISKNQKTS